MKSKIEDRLNELYKQKVLLKTDDIDSIRGDLHYTQLWADTLWRRRFRHETREDPELYILKKLKAENILEIGSAYGRFSRKALNIIKNRIQYTGIEVCESFKPYIDNYIPEFYDTKNFHIQFDNFFTTEKLDQDQFDLIILPMNTLPNFPQRVLPNLLTKVKQLLAPDGQFLFTTHETPHIDEVLIEKKKKRFRSGEILLDPKSPDRIIIEFIPLYFGKTDYGASDRYCLLYHRLNEEYSVLERALFWSQTELYQEGYLDQLLREHRFQIDMRNMEYHSSMYLVSPISNTNL